MRYEGQLVEAFVYGPVALQRWVKKGRIDRRPVLDKLIGEGIALTASADTRSLQEAARTALNEGPAPLSGDELRQRLYASLVSSTTFKTRLTPARPSSSATAWRESAELALLIDQRWLGSGKWLLREVRLGA